MFDKISEKFADAVIANEIQPESEKTLLVIGCQSALSFILNIFGTIIFSASLGIFKEGLIFLLSFYLLRICASGFHMDNAASCFWFSLSVEFLMVFLMKYFLMNNIFYYMSISLITCFVCIFLSPVPNLKRLQEENTRKRTRNICVVLFFIELLISLLIILGFKLNIGYAFLYGWLLFITLNLMGHIQNRFKAHTFQ